MKTDAETRDDVISELGWNPRVSGPDAIGVAVLDGAVTLPGRNELRREMGGCPRARILRWRSTGWKRRKGSCGCARRSGAPRIARMSRVGQCMRGAAAMTQQQPQTPRDYGGWRRRRGIGPFGLGTADRSMTGLVTRLAARSVGGSLTWGFARCVERICALSRSYGQFGRRFRRWPGDLHCWRGWCSGYFKVSGIGVLMRSNASRCWLVGSASMATVALVPANLTWLRVRVARWSSRPRKLR